MEREKIMKTKMVALFATLMIALMAAGVAYAMWDKYLYIHCTANTGEVNAQFRNCRCSDTGIDPGYDKDVGSCYCEIDTVDPQILYLTIDNAYPSYSCDIYYAIENHGTIPVKIESIDLSGVPAEFTVSLIGAGVGTQIEAGEYVECGIHVHVEQITEQLKTIYFDIGVHLVQWNEYP
jgi:hypothetical protein